VDFDDHQDNGDILSYLCHWIGVVMVRRLVLILACSTGFSGCAVHELQKDHDLIRTTLLDLYASQILDNLVRAADGMPIVQLDYTNAAAQVTIMNNISGTDSQATTVSKAFTIPATTLSATRSIVTTLMGGVGSSNTNQVSLVATPVTTNNDVYDAYIDFLDQEKHPGSLVISPCPPNPGEAHVCKKANGRYYWVPAAYKDLYFRLSLLTTVQRGKPLSAPDPFFIVVVQRISGEPKPGQKLLSGDFKEWLVTVELDRKVPNDTGYLVFDGDHTQYGLRIDESKPDGKLSQSQFATLYVKNADLKTFQARLLDPIRARIYLDHKQPTGPTADDNLNKISFQLQQIQFNQLRQPSSGP
jgi:hypothetical protein